MRIRVLGCSGGSVPGCNPSCYLLDGGVAVDAGALAATLTIEEQRQVEHVFMTHAHWDHVRDLPLTVINRDSDTPTLQVYGLPETMRAIRTHLMNDVVWFSAFELPSQQSPFIAANDMLPGDVQVRNGYTIHAFAVPHTVPAISYVIDDGTSAIILNGDTGGGNVLESRPAGTSELKAVFLESSFPNEMREFAELTGHLTPEMLADEIRGLPAAVEVLVTHMKPGFEDTIRAELADLGRPGLRAVDDGEILVF